MNNNDLMTEAYDKLSADDFDGDLRFIAEKFGTSIAIELRETFPSSMFYIKKTRTEREIKKIIPFLASKGVKINIAARLLNISRSTIYKYYNGGKRKNKELKESIARQGNQDFK